MPKASIVTLVQLFIAGNTHWDTHFSLILLDFCSLVLAEKSFTNAVVLSSRALKKDLRE